MMEFFGRMLAGDLLDNHADRSDLDARVDAVVQRVDALERHVVEQDGKVEELGTRVEDLERNDGRGDVGK